MSVLVDLVLIFKGTSPSLSKQRAAEDSQHAQADYTRLIRILTDAGLKATGRQGEKQGQLLVIIWAPPRTISQLVQKERHSDFLLGLPTPILPGHARDYTAVPLAPADRLRLVYDHVTSLTTEGGLGITPGVKQWRRVESVMTLHDYAFNETWIHQWTRRKIGINFGFVELNKLRDQFGESVALYFAFLSSYTQSLFFPSVIGILFWAFSSPYSPWYSAFITIWSICWVEWWRVRERILSARWGTLGFFRAEKRRPEFHGNPGHSGEENNDEAFPWWQRDIRVLCSLPLILFFAGILAAILTAIFVFEAFVTQLYQGPLHQYISLAPTILFVALVPRVLALYHSLASKLTDWENHAHQSAHDASLTIKTFTLSAIVAYLGLALSAFVYVPFGPFVMSAVQTHFARSMDNASRRNLFEMNAREAQRKINPENRLLNEMFAYTVTNQVTNAFAEVILPYIMRGVEDVRNGKGVNGKKRVALEDETATQKEERIFLEQVNHQVSLPDYTLFGDYAEMVTQFGYVALWSTIWPLAPLMSFLNNWFEMRGDAFKIMTHGRRPLPARVDTIGAWLDSLGTISWLSALTNTALVYIFRMRDTGVFSAEKGLTAAWHALLMPAFLLTLSSSHGYLLVRWLVQHMMHRAMWQGSEELRTLEHNQTEIKNMFLKTTERDEEITELDVAQFAQGGGDAAAKSKFWAKDEAGEELQRAMKEA